MRQPLKGILIMVHRLSILVILLVLLAACGGAPAAPAPVPTGAPAAAAPTGAPAAATAFPVIIEHKYGTVTISAEPQRVIALGYSEVDPILALGVVPVAVRDWFGDQPNAVWPWSQPALGGATPIVLTMPFGELNYETIAALAPDLIVATHSGITEDEYTTLSQIAPTLAQTGDVPDFGMPWQAQTKLIGQALGRAEQAEQLVAGVEAQIAAAAAANPQLQGATVAWASPAEGGAFWVVGPTTPPLRFLTALGMSYPNAVAEFVGTADSQQLSAERLDLIDTDVLIFYAGTALAREAIESNPLYQQLNATQQGRVIFFEGNDPIYGALSYSTVASLPYALERLVPLLLTARTGNAAAAAITALNCPAGFRPFAHSAGETCVPANPQRIVATQDQNALLPLLELGVKPIGSAGLPLESGGFRFRRVDDFDSSGIAFIGNYWGEANAETIARLQPDLIVGDAYGVDYYDLHSQIAPTVLIDVHGRPLDEALLDFAALVGRSDQAARLRDAYMARVAALLEALGERKDSLSVSVITNGEGGEFYRADTGQALGTVMSDLDLLRPAPQQGEGSFDAFSLETLPDHDADVVLVINFASDDSAPGFDAFVKSPIFQTLAAARAGQTYVIDGTQTVGAGWTKMDAFLAELERILLAPDLDVNVVAE